MEHNATINENPGEIVAMENPITGGADLPGMAAARSFANIKELIIMMGNHLPIKDLPSLCLVNKLFNAMFSQRLYQKIRLDSKFLHPESLAWVAGNRNFCHTKTFSFDKLSKIDANEIPGYEPADGPPWGPPLPEWICVLVQRAATDILRSSPTLHTIHLDSTAIGSDKAVLIINNGLDGKFHGCGTHLQSLALNLSSAPCRELSVSVFKEQRLKNLCLLNIPTATWRVSLLCRILMESPALRCLRLSYLNGAENQWAFEEICKQYSQLGGTPLKLEIMILGRGVNLKLPEQVPPFITGDRPAQATYLALLIETTCLQEMRVNARTNAALGTFDLSFFPNMNRFRLSAATRHEHIIRNFFAMRKTRDFLRQVHLQVDGALFRKYENVKGMTQLFFGPGNLIDPASDLAPMGFSFLSKLRLEDDYKRSVALPLPTTRFLDITIHYNHLVGFSGIGLSKMSALECLSLNVYVYNISQWDDIPVIGEKQLKALEKAANTCPNLRYVRMNMGSTGPVSAAIANLSCSREIVREHKPRCRKLKPVFKVVGEGADKLLCPQSMWTEAEKRAQYIEDDLDQLVYHKPSWME